MPDDFWSTFPKPQVPDMPTVFCLVSRFREACSVSARKGPGRLTLVNDVSVENIRHF
jgi:hypothetical protein